MKLKFTIFLLLTTCLLRAQNYVSLSALNQPYTQNFNTLDTLATTPYSSVLPTGWLLFENGTGGNSTYRGGTGASNTGDTYSFGSTGQTERALGSIASGSLQSIFGANFVNKTAGTITSVQISFTMEQWRSGGRTSNDTCQFSYGINNGSLRTGVYTRLNSLDLFSKILNPTGIALNGNDSANQRVYNYTITGITLQPDDTLFIKWTDRDVTGSDDGLSIDDFSLNAFGSGILLPDNITQFTASQKSASVATISWQKPAEYNNDSFTTLVFVKVGSSITTGTNNKFDLNLFTANNSLPGGTAWPNDANAKCVYKGDSNTFDLNNLTGLTTYYLYGVVVRNLDTIYASGVSANFTTVAGNPAPNPVTGLFFSNIGSNTIKINWTKANGYTDSTHTTLVFLKKASAITQGLPNKNPLNYVASSVFNMPMSVYQNDTAAKCVLNADSSNVIITGLEPTALYHALIYVARNEDSSYSTSIIGSTNTTSLPLNAVTQILVTGTSNTTARINWTKPTGYINSGYTTLVFVKADSAINSGSATLAPNKYFANPSVVGTGTPFFADAAAKCVYKGDTNFVNITNMSFIKNYYVVIQVVKDLDSVYSAPAYGSGTSAGPPPHYNIAPCVKTNITTGLPDSNNVRATFYGVVYGFNQRTTGIQFVLQDATGGISVLHNTKNFGYMVTEGDSIMVSGLITSNRGLATISTLDTVILIANNANLKLPVEYTNLNESTENKLVFLRNLKFLNKPTSGNWPTNNSVVNMLTPLNDTIGVKVVNTSVLSGKSLPTTTYFDLIGLGTQVSTSFNAPFAFNGYQLIPRVETDIIENPDADSLKAFSLLSPGNNLTQTIQGDTGNSLSFGWSASKKSITTSLNVIYTFQLDATSGNFSAPKIVELSSLNGSDTTYSISFQNITNKLVLTPGVTYNAKWRIKAQLGNYVRYSTVTYNIPLMGGTLTMGINNIALENSINIYPNPANKYITVDGKVIIESLDLINLAGSTIFSTIGNTMQLPQITAGLYFIKVNTSKGSAIKKVIIN